MYFQYSMRCTFRFLIFATLLPLLSSCSRLPRLTPLTGMLHMESEEICREPFPTQPWRAVHSIHISGPFGIESSVIGVTVVDPASRRIRAVILSLEGMVLFDASCEEGVPTVYRAIPPLDRKGFPDGLLRDVSLIFLSPEGVSTQTGRDDKGRLVCRWQNIPTGTTTDVIVFRENRWQLLQYERDNDLKRKVEMQGVPGEEPLTNEIHLSYHGLVGYSLDLSLLEAEFLTDYETLFSP